MKGSESQHHLKKGAENESPKPTGSKSTGEGQKLGTVCKLKSGKVVYVPENAEK